MLDKREGLKLDGYEVAIEFIYIHKAIQAIKSLITLLDM
jgi:hypothetical protein